MVEKKFKNDAVELWLEDGIVYVKYEPFVTIDLELAKMVVAVRHEITEGKSYPLFVDVRKIKTLTKEARAYVSTDDGHQGLSAAVIMIKTQIEAFLANAWMSLYPTPVPTKLFTDEEAAIKWLKRYKPSTLN